MVARDRSLSARTSCLETHAFFFFNVTFFFSMRDRGEGRRGEQVRSDANVPRQVEFRKIAWKVPCIWKTNLKPNLGNQLRGLRKRRERSALSFSLSVRVFSSPLTGDMDLPVTALPCVRGLCQHGLNSIFSTVQCLICCQNVLRVLLKKCHSSFPCNAVHMLVKGGMSKDLNSFAF